MGLRGRPSGGPLFNPAPARPQSEGKDSQMGHLLGAPILAWRQVRVAGQALMSSGAGWVVSQYSGGGLGQAWGLFLSDSPLQCPGATPRPCPRDFRRQAGGRGSPQVSGASATLNSRWVGQGFPWCSLPHGWGARNGRVSGGESGPPHTVLLRSPSGGTGGGIPAHSCHQGDGRQGP